MATTMQRPGVLTALCVLSIVLAALGMTRPNRAALFARQTPNDPQWA